MKTAVFVTPAELEQIKAEERRLWGELQEAKRVETECSRRWCDAHERLEDARERSSPDGFDPIAMGITLATM
jgi:hypothetical protein